MTVNCNIMVSTPAAAVPFNYFTQSPTKELLNAKSALSKVAESTTSNYITPENSPRWMGHLDG